MIAHLRNRVLNMERYKAVQTCLVYEDRIKMTIVSSVILFLVLKLL